MSKLSLVKSEMFGDVQCDFYRTDEKSVCMTTEQLGQALGYEFPKQAISKILNRNEYLRSSDFSGVVKMGTPAGEQETRVFTEDGIYEVTMLSKTERAREFRAFVRGVLKDLRRGTIKAFKAIDPEILQVRQINAQARMMNARRKDAEFLIQQANGANLSPVAVELLKINAIEMIAGKNALPRPKVDNLYSATEIAAEVGTSRNHVGKIANLNGLKTDEYGVTVLSKSEHSAKQIPMFMYNEKGREAILKIIKGGI